MIGTLGFSQIFQHVGCPIHRVDFLRSHDLGHLLDVGGVLGIANDFIDGGNNLALAGHLGQTNTDPFVNDLDQVVALIAENGHSDHGDTKVDGLHDPMHAAMGEKGFGDVQPKDFLLRNSAHHHHVVRDGKINFIQIKLGDDPQIDLAKSIKDFLEPFQWNCLRIKYESHGEEQDSVIVMPDELLDLRTELVQVFLDLKSSNVNETLRLQMRIINEVVRVDDHPVEIADEILGGFEILDVISDD